MLQSAEQRIPGGASMPTFTGGYFVGSLAKGSINRKLSKALVRLAPPKLTLPELHFGELPHYCWDYDADYPPIACAFKDSLSAVDAYCS